MSEGVLTPDVSADRDHIQGSKSAPVSPIATRGKRGRENST